MLVCLLLARGSEKRNERRGDLPHIYLMVKADTGSYCRTFGVSEVWMRAYPPGSWARDSGGCHSGLMVGIALLLIFAFGCQAYLVYSWEDMLHSLNSAFSSAFYPPQEQLSGARTSSTTTPQRPFPRTSPTTLPRQSARMSGMPCVSVAGFFFLFS